jgi:hypothetical protein
VKKQRKGLFLPLLFCIGVVNAQGSLSLSKQGKELTFACAWEESSGKLGFDGKRFDWKRGEFSGVAGQGALGSWRALCSNPYYNLGESAGSPWLDSTRFLVVGVKSKHLGFIIATDREGDAQTQGRRGYFGLEGSIADIKTEVFAVESSLSFALTESKRNSDPSGWSARLQPQCAEKLLHLGSYTNLSFGDWRSTFWLSGYKPQFGYFDFASALGIGLDKKLNAHVSYGLKTSAFFCGAGYRNILGEVPSFDRVLGLESEITLGALQIKAGLRSISKGIGKDSLENIRLFDPDASGISRLGWIWKTDAIFAKFSALWTSGLIRPSFRAKASFDNGGFAAAAADAALELGNGYPISKKVTFSLGATFSRSEVAGEEEWNEDQIVEDSSPRSRTQPGLGAIKGAFSLHWPGFDNGKKPVAKGISLGQGNMTFSMRWASNGIFFTCFSMSQKILISRHVDLLCTLSSPEDGYVIFPWDSAMQLAIPDFRLALAIDHWL